MPVYQYLCRDCGHDFEAVQSMRDDSLTVCPACGGTLRKVFAPPVIAFKGSGFYSTDHGKKKRKVSASKADKEGATARSDSAEPASTSPPAKEEKKDSGSSSTTNEAASS